MGKESGLKAENYFQSRMNQAGLSSEYIDSFYDFDVCGVKVEVKSCSPCVRQRSNRKDSHRSGRFDFTCLSNRELQYQENVWVCLIVRANDDFLMLGFLKARQLNKRRYLALNQYRRHKLLTFDEWVSIVNR